MKVRKELKVVGGGNGEEVNRTEALSESIPRAVFSLSHAHTHFFCQKNSLGIAVMNCGVICL